VLFTNRSRYSEKPIRLSTPSFENRAKFKSIALQVHRSALYLLNNNFYLFIDFRFYPLSQFFSLSKTYPQKEVLTEKQPENEK